MNPEPPANGSFQISMGKDNRWEVRENGYDKPVASFHSREIACKYANDIAKSRAGARVLIDDRVPEPPPQQQH